MREKVIQSKKDCKLSCRFKCENVCDAEIRQKMFEQFYKFDQNGKHAFIDSTTEQSAVKRQTTKDEETNTKKQTRRRNSIGYFFKPQGTKVKVCKSFYLSTLAISQKMVYTVHNSKDEATSALKPDGRGKHGNCSTTPDATRSH